MCANPVGGPQYREGMSFIVSVAIGVIVSIGALWVVGAAFFALYDWATEHRTPQPFTETDDEIDHRFY